MGLQRACARHKTLLRFLHEEGYIPTEVKFEMPKVNKSLLLSDAGLKNSKLTILTNPFIREYSKKAN
jgi:hypothetical protein